MYAIYSGRYFYVYDDQNSENDFYYGYEITREEIMETIRSVCCGSDVNTFQMNIILEMANYRNDDVKILNVLSNNVKKYDVIKTQELKNKIIKLIADTNKFFVFNVSYLGINFLPEETISKEISNALIKYVNGELLKEYEITDYDDVLIKSSEKRNYEQLCDEYNENPKRKRSTM